MGEELEGGGIADEMISGGLGTDFRG